MKIPKDISSIQRRMAEAAAARRRQPVTPPAKKPDTTIDPERKRVNAQAAEDRRKAREAMQTAAEKDARVKELEEALETANRKVAELEAPADRWNKYSHREKELLIARFPKEEQARARKMDIDDLKWAAEKAGYLTASTTEGGAPKQKAGTITSMEDAVKPNVSPEEFNKFVDDVAAGTIKLDSSGKVMA